MSQLPYHEPQVRILIEANHIPEEEGIIGPNGQYQAKVICSQCKQRWPCEEINRLREWRNRQREEDET